MSGDEVAARDEESVRSLLPRVMDLCPPRSRPTYQIGFRRLVEAFGDRHLPDVTPMDLQALRDQVRLDVGTQKVAKARSTGRRLRSYDPDAHGKGAAENFVRSARFFFRVAQDCNLITVSPAANLKPPKRPQAPERPLTPSELADLYDVATRTGDDPPLDRLIVLLLRHTACRREGVINLTLDALDPARRRITVSEKRGEVRELPLNPTLIHELAIFARARGATHGSDAVLRYRTGAPLTRRRFNTLFDRLDEHTDWSEALDVGAHWVRHTTLSDIAAVAGLRVAEAYAGHSPSDGPTIFRYTKIPFEELERAYERTFQGELE